MVKRRDFVYSINRPFLLKRGKRGQSFEQFQRNRSFIVSGESGGFRKISYEGTLRGSAR
jgi:hypothetical protein